VLVSHHHRSRGRTVIHDDEVARRVIYRHPLKSVGGFRPAQDTRDSISARRWPYRATINLLDRLALNLGYIVLLLRIESRSDAKLVDIIIERTHELQVHLGEPLVLSRHVQVLAVNVITFGQHCGLCPNRLDLYFNF